MTYNKFSAEEVVQTEAQASDLIRAYGHTFLPQANSDSWTVKWVSGITETFDGQQLIRTAQNIWRLSTGQACRQLNHAIDEWPAGHGAKVLVDQVDGYRHQIGRPYLTAGYVAYVDSDEGDYLIVTAENTPDQASGNLPPDLVPISKNFVVPVPNALPVDPDEIEERLTEDEALVGNLLDAGYTLDRFPGESDLANFGRDADRESWEAFLGARLDVGFNGFTLLHKCDGGEVSIYLTETAWPTTFSVATEA